ncbi:hypothetical protein V6250_21165, partial [Pseudoalteromonas undina]
NDNWRWGYGVPNRYLEVVNAARELGLKIIALDLTLDELDLIDASCSYNNSVAGNCFYSHTIRNMVWTQN